MEKNKIQLLFLGVGLIILLTLFVLAITLEPTDKNPNVYYFDGKITKIIQSNNHDFSIYIIKLDTSHITVFDSTFYLSNKNYYPMFRYKGDLGEVYMTISDEDSLGYRIKCDSPKNTVIIINNKGKIVNTTSMFPITESRDINFIKTNSRIK